MMLRYFLVPKSIFCWKFSVEYYATILFEIQYYIYFSFHSFSHIFLIWIGHNSTLHSQLVMIVFTYKHIFMSSLI